MHEHNYCNNVSAETPEQEINQLPKQSAVKYGKSVAKKYGNHGAHIYHLFTGWPWVFGILFEHSRKSFQLSFICDNSTEDVSSLFNIMGKLIIGLPATTRDLRRVYIGCQKKQLAFMMLRYVHHRCVKLSLAGCCQLVQWSNASRVV